MYCLVMPSVTFPSEVTNKAFVLPKNKETKDVILCKQPKLCYCSKLLSYPLIINNKEDFKKIDLRNKIMIVKIFFL